MRIHHLSAAAIPSRTANSIQTMKMTAALAALGHDVTLFCSPGDDEVAALDPYDYYGVDRTFAIVYCAWPARRGGGLWYAGAVMRQIRARGAPDLFYGRHLMLLAIADAFGKPLVAEVHLPASSAFARALMRRLVRSPRLERLIVISEALRDEYRRQFPALDPARVVVAASGADAAPAPAPAPLMPAGGSMRSCAGYVGHLYAGKGMEVIHALARMMPQVDFHVIGGLEPDLHRWRRLAAHPNLLFHGHVPPSRVPDWMRSFQIALAPYQERVNVSGGGDAAKWMSPLKLFEYMAHGKAIVASDLPVIREVVQDGCTGVLCRPDSPDSWCSAIQMLIDKPGLARELGTRARRRFERAYTWRERARRVLE